MNWLHLLSSGEESDEHILRLSDSTSVDSVKLSSKGTIKLLSNWHLPVIGKLLLQTELSVTVFSTLSGSTVKSKLLLLLVFSKFTWTGELGLSGGFKSSTVAQFKASEVRAFYSYINNSNTNVKWINTLSSTLTNTVDCDP